MFKKISKIAIACLFLSFILGSFNFVGIKTVNATVNFNPNVTIPGSDFKHEEPNKDKPDKKLGTQLSKSTKPIADYMKALYNWGIGVVGVLAGVVLVIAGIIWLTAGGNNTQVETAKKWIAGSLSGLVLALGSYFLLYQINPDLVKFQYYDIPGVDVRGSKASHTGYHYACSSNNGVIGCMLIPGTGPDQCTDSDQCIGKEVENCSWTNACIVGQVSGDISCGVKTVEETSTHKDICCCN